jgi:hypothetical protein
MIPPFWFAPPPSVFCERCGECVLEKDKDLMCYEEFLERYAQAG